jgi:hypothetical protein
VTLKSLKKLNKIKTDLNEIKSKLKIADFIIALALPSIITIIFLLPYTIKQLLVFNRESMVFWSFFTSDFVHLNSNHYVGNIANLCVALVIQLIAVSIICQKKKYLKTVLILIFSVPFMGSAINYFIQPYVILSYGSSGLVAAIVGIFPIIFLSYFKNTRPNKNILYYLFLGMTLLIFFFKYAIHISDTFLILIGLTVIAIACINPLQQIIKKEKNQMTICLFFLLPIAFFSLVIGAFPSVLLTNNSVTNIIIHFFGLVYGLTISHLIFNGFKG